MLIIPRAVFAAFGREQGAIAPARETALSPIEVAVPGVRPDPRRVALFRDVCAVRTPPDRLPLSYPECLFLGPMAEAVLSPVFPLSPFGLIHVRQGIEQYRPTFDEVFVRLLERAREEGRAEAAEAFNA